MAGKKNKLRKVLSPSNATPEPPPSVADDTLVDDLLNQLDAKDPTVQTEAAAVLQDVEINRAAQADAASGSKSRNKFEARKLRKAAALMQQLPPGDKESEARLQEEANREEKQIQAVCSDLGLVVHEINPDGHCLYAAIADQLCLLGLLPTQVAHYATTRATASQYIYTHPDDFLPFLPSVEGEDGAGSGDPGLMSPRQFEQYCATIRDTGTWGGEPEILALSRAFNVPIHVVQGGTPPIVMHNPVGIPAADIAEGRVVRISYHRRMYGLGEHYNSLRPRKGVSDTIKSFLS